MKEKETILMQDQILSKNCNALLEWRKQFSRKEYPQHVVRKMFYDFYTDQELWPFIVDIFNDMSDVRTLLNLRICEHIEYIDEVNFLFEARKKLKTEKILPRLDALLNENIPVVNNIRFSDYSQMIENAINGNDSDLEKIEYHFMFYKMTSDLISFWAAAGIYGKKWDDAMFFVTGMLVGGKIETFEDVFMKFSKISGLYLAGINTTTGKNFGKYKPLPPFK
ncbi:MAG: hypothetical protein NUV47_03450 [Patescibacteria group bacterium]|nr:hypothetical protein [Patescibacteria group bacterium]